MNRLALATATILAALAARTVPAAADGSVNLPGVACQTGYAEGQTSYYDDGRLYNDSTTWWRTAICPITRPVAAAVNVRAVAQVVDMNFTLDASCRLITTTDAGVTRWGAAVSTSGTSATPQSLRLPDSGYVADGTAFVLCYLPQVYAGQRSALASFSAASFVL